MKLRLVLALISLAVACGAIAIKASTQANASATPATTSIGNETCADCDGPDPAAVLPNPYKADASTPPAAAPAAPVTPTAQTAPATPAKN